MYITDTALKVRRANAYRIFMRRNRVTPTLGGTVRRQALKYAWYKAEARAARVLMARIYRYERERAHGGQPLTTYPKTASFTNVYNLPALPPWQPYKGGSATPGQPAFWSGSAFAEPPAIGSRVRVAINNFGPGEVLAYFVEHGFLGVKVRPDVRPAWHVEQNPGRDFCLVFGAEIAQLGEPENVKRSR